MINKIKSKEHIMSHFKDGQTIAIGGLAAAFMPWELIDMLYESEAKHLTLICMDGCEPGMGHSKLLEAGRVDKMITTHIGMNPVASKLMLEGKLEVELCPIGNWSERIRCAGAGLGGILTRTGVGTVVAEGKQTIDIDGVTYLLEKSFKPDIAISRCRRCDPMGNLAYHGTGETSHSSIAMSAPLSIVQTDLYCDFEEISIDEIKVPGMYVDEIYIPGPYDEYPLLGPPMKAKLAKGVK